MSALGQKRTSRQLERMSALPLKADIDQDGHDVRSLPQTGNCVCKTLIGCFSSLIVANVTRRNVAWGLLAATQLTCGPRICFKAASIPLHVSASSVSPFSSKFRAF